MNTTTWIIIIVALVALAAWILLGSKKRRWYKVYLANNDVMLLYRDMNERWWRTNGTYLRFKDEHDREITFPSQAHWVLMWETVDEKELEVVKSEIKRMKEAIAERNAQ